MATRELTGRLGWRLSALAQREMQERGVLYHPRRLEGRDGLTVNGALMLPARTSGAHADWQPDGCYRTPPRHPDY